MTSSEQTPTVGANEPTPNVPRFYSQLKKAHKALPAFEWDTNPMVSQEKIVEEAFVDVFCDLLMECSTGVGGLSAELAKH